MKFLMVGLLFLAACGQHNPNQIPNLRSNQPGTTPSIKPIPEHNETQTIQGKGGGNGGGVVRCEQIDNDGQTQYQTLQADLYEGMNTYHLKMRNFHSLTEEQILRTVLLKLKNYDPERHDRVKQQLERYYKIRVAPTFLLQFAKKWGNKFIPKMITEQFKILEIPADPVDSYDTKDYYDLSIADNCQYYPTAMWIDQPNKPLQTLLDKYMGGITESVLFQHERYKELDQRGKASLAMHEAIFRDEREINPDFETSKFPRKLNAYLFSTCMKSFDECFAIR